MPLLILRRRHLTTIKRKRERNRAAAIYLVPSLAVLAAPACVFWGRVGGGGGEGRTPLPSPSSPSPHPPTPPIPPARCAAPFAGECDKKFLECHWNWAPQKKGGGGHFYVGEEMTHNYLLLLCSLASSSNPFLSVLAWLIIVQPERGKKNNASFKRGQNNFCRIISPWKIHLNS